MKENFYTKAFHLLLENRKADYEISFILSKKNEDNSIGFIAYAINRNDPDDMVYVSDGIEEYLKCSYEPDWSFNIDEDLFQNLEQDFNLEYMSLDTHHGIWYGIEEWYPDDIEYINGMQQYLSYCYKHGITHCIVTMEEKSVSDIMKYYQEHNAGYDIIARTDIGSTSIVLAHKNKGNTPYVTWRTTPNIKNGYAMGHYFASYRQAIDDYKERCRTVLEVHLDHQRARTKPHKKKPDHER